MRNFLRMGRVFLNKERSIHSLYVGMSTLCNLRCRYCGIDHTRESIFLDISLFEKLLVNLIEGDYSVEWFVLGLSGESLLHPEFHKFIDLLRDYREDAQIANTLVTSNMVLLNKRVADLLVTSGVIDYVQCSIDGYDAASFEYFRPPAKYERVIDNFETLCDVNDFWGQPVEITINNGNLNATIEFTDDFAKHVGRAVSVNRYEFHDWGRPASTPQNLPKRFCRYSFRYMTLLPDGMIGKCCYDLNGHTAYGNLNTHTLDEILTSKRRKRDLLKMFLGKRDDVEGCAGCTVED